MFKDKPTVSQVFIGLLGTIRGIISCPFRLIIIAIGVPNTKIVYRSGHVEYYYFLRWRYERNRETGVITEMEWVTVGQKEPLHINIREIESIVQTY